MSTVNGGPRGPRFLLDVVGARDAAIAYSLRRLRGGYTGPAIRVRRSNDNAETNIGFNINGDFDEAALTSFVGANNGFVTTWYDQSGNGLNATSGFPIIITAGTVQKKNNRPCLLFDATGRSFVMPNVDTLHTSRPSAFFLTLSDNNVFDGSFSGYFGNFRYGRAEVGINVHALNSNGSLSVEVRNGNFVVNNVTSPNALTNSSMYLISSINDFGNAVAANRNYLYINSTLYQNNTQTTTPTTSPASRGVSLGVIPVANQGHLSGTLSEFIIYYSDKSTARSTIQANINSYYTIY